MLELNDHKAYDLLATKYPDCLLDYIILLHEGADNGVETHKAAVLAAFAVLQSRRRIGNRFDLKLTLTPDGLSATPCTMSQLLALPPDDRDLHKGTRGVRSHTIPAPLPYWYAFLEPPYDAPYGIADFIKVNDALFPYPDRCRVYRWNDGFSNYFDAGKEWWGTGCWSVFDPVTGQFVIIGASLSD